MRKVFIYGGCTSRDAVDYYGDYGLELQSYIARQSLISAYRPADPHLFDTANIQGTFQRRMVRGDISGALPEHLVSNASEIDLVVWDLMIERVGVQKINSGGMITRNGVPRRTGVQQSALGGSYTFGTDEHLRQWTWSLYKFVDTLRSVDLRGKVVINATPWATVNQRGERMESDSSMTPEWFNENVLRYWEAAEKEGFKVARVSQEDAIADTEHKWGPAYFHYVPETYRAQLRAITSLL
ncbi:MAG: DUF6270 domain-containing protein [Brachybacterium tyrofermentans]